MRNLFLCLSIALMALVSLVASGGLAMAMSVREQAVINTFRTHVDAKTADRVQRAFEQIDKNYPDPDENRKQKIKFLDERLAEAEVNVNKANVIGGEEEIVKARMVQGFYHWLKAELIQLGGGDYQKYYWTNRSAINYVLQDIVIDGDREFTLLQAAGSECRRLAGEQEKGSEKGSAPDCRPAEQVPSEPKKTSLVPGRQAQGLAASPGSLGLNANVAFGEQHLPTFVYLGFENALLEQTFAVENLDDDVDFTAFGGDLAFTVDPIIGVVGSQAFFAFGFNTFDVDGSTFRSEIDPLGRDLLLAFTITPGISLGSGVPEGTPGGANVVTDFAYRYDADQFSLYAKYGERWECWDGVFTGYAGLAYTNLDQRQFAGGDVPGFLSSFAYDTNLEVDTWRIVAGLRYERPLWDNSLGNLSVFGDAMGSINFVDGQGRDSVTVSGFLNFSEAVNVSKSDTTFGYSLGVGLVQHIDEAAMDVYLAYRHYGDETTPVVVRHDDGPSHLTFETSEFDVIVAGARVQF
jgi:hypothetical protein